MRDNQRPKQDLVHEVTGLRKQIQDLREAMVARRRVEEALREAESRLRSLTDSVPVGLCLFRSDGMPIVANGPFAHMLGYDSASELQRVGGVLGIFGSMDEQSRVLGGVSGPASVADALFRHKSGARVHFSALAGLCVEQGRVAVAIYDHPIGGSC